MSTVARHGVTTLPSPTHLTAAPFDAHRNLSGRIGNADLPSVIGTGGGAMGPRRMGGVRVPWLPGAWFGTGRRDAKNSALGVAAVHFPGPLPLPLPRPPPGFACMRSPYHLMHVQTLQARTCGLRLHLLVVHLRGEHVSDAACRVLLGGASSANATRQRKALVPLRDNSERCVVQQAQQHVCWDGQFAEAVQFAHIEAAIQERQIRALTLSCSRRRLSRCSIRMRRWKMASSFSPTTRMNCSTAARFTCMQLKH